MKSLKEYIVESMSPVYDNSGKHEESSEFWKAEVIKYIYRWLLTHSKKFGTVYKTEHHQYLYKLSNGERLCLAYDPKHTEILKSECPEATSVIPEIKYKNGSKALVTDLSKDQLKQLYNTLKETE